MKTSAETVLRRNFRDKRWEQTTEVTKPMGNSWVQCSHSLKLRVLGLVALALSSVAVEDIIEQNEENIGVADYTTFSFDADMIPVPQNNVSGTLTFLRSSVRAATGISNKWLQCGEPTQDCRDRLG